MMQKDPIVFQNERKAVENKKSSKLNQIKQTLSAESSPRLVLFIFLVLQIV